MSNTLRVHEIYRSIQGESTWAGLPCIFIRLTGCPLRCSYCDTAYAFKGGQVMDVDSVLDQVEKLADGGGTAHYGAGKHKMPLVELTGGEPLAQKNSVLLMKLLVDRGFTVLLETSGSLTTKAVPAEVHVILDIKTPSSGESSKNLEENLYRLKISDEVKFVVSCVEDLDFMRELIERRQLADCSQILVSWASPLTPDQSDPSLKKVPTGLTPVTRLEVVNYILAHRLPVRFQLQMHKFIWPPDEKGV